MSRFELEHSEAKENCPAIILGITYYMVLWVWYGYVICIVGTFGRKICGRLLELANLEFLTSTKFGGLL